MILQSFFVLTKHDNVVIDVVSYEKLEDTSRAAWYDLSLTSVLWSTVSARRPLLGITCCTRPAWAVEEA